MTTGPIACGVVLAYHRIAEPACDPYGTALSPDLFDRQLGALRKVGELVSLHDFEEGLASGRRRMIAVTFDDGYADLLGAALPVLEHHGVPATMFVATGWVETPREPWWDTILRHTILLDTAATVSIDIGPLSYRWLLPDRSDDQRADDLAWTTMSEARSEHQSTLVALHRLLRRLTPDECDAAIATLCSDAPGDADLGRPLSRHELTELGEHPLIELGGHSVSHPELASLDPIARRREVADGVSQLRAWTGQPIDRFAYPYGDGDAVDEVTMTAVHEAGLRTAYVVDDAVSTIACSPLLQSRWMVHGERDRDPASLARRMLVRMVRTEAGHG